MIQNRFLHAAKFVDFFVFLSKIAVVIEKIVMALKHHCKFFLQKKFFVTLQSLSGSIDMGCSSRS